MIIKTKYLIPLILILFLIFTLTGFAKWYIPDVHYDPDNAWENETLVYDDLDNTAGSNIISAAKTWGSFILLDVYSELHCEKVRFLAYSVGATGIEQIDIDLYYNSQWNDLYEGVFDNEVWTELELPTSQYLYSARVRFYAKKADTALLYGFEFWNPAITVGTAPVNRGTNLANRTMINKDAPANGTGKITSVEIWLLATDESDVYIATFYTTDTNEFSTRDYVNIGFVTSGSKQTITVDSESNPISLDVVEGDYIGVSLAGSVEADATGGSGIWYLAVGTRTMPCTEVTFSLLAAGALSLQATGETAEVEGGTHIFFTLPDF